MAPSTRRSPRVLFVTYGGGHADIVARVYEKVIEQGCDARVFALTTAPSLLSERGIPHSTCADYLAKMPGYESAMSLGETLSRGFWVSGSGVSWRDSCAYMGVSMLDLIAGIGEDAAFDRYRREGRRAFLPVSFAERVQELESPDLVVTTCHVRMERASVIAAKTRRIKSLLIEDLLGYSMLGERPLDTAELVYHSDEWPDFVAVWNRWVKSRLFEAGFPEDRILVAGQPVFSDWSHEYDDAPGLAWLEEDGRPVVTYVAPARRDVLEEQTRELSVMASTRRDLLFVIKLHPSVAREGFRVDDAENLRVIRSENIVSVVKSSSVVLTFQSTVGILCAIKRKPLLVLNCGPEPDPSPYVFGGCAVRVSSYSDLLPAIDKALSVGTITAEDIRVFENPPAASSTMARTISALAGLGGRGILDEAVV